jgi:cysteine desulfurase
MYSFVANWTKHSPDADKSDIIDLDANATTSLHPAAAEAMARCWRELGGNSASAHRLGQRARQALESARETVAHLLDAEPAEVLFTSGATEANNLALHGLLAGQPHPRHIVASPLEHPSVSEVLERWRTKGEATIDWLPADADGQVRPDDLRSRLRPQTRLVTVMLANHEMGAVLPVGRLAVAASGVAFHCDAVQAVGKIPVSFRQLGVTTLSASAHKFHGPQGVGLLLVRRGTALEPLLYGGHQQGGRRPGTEPVALAVGCATALESACREMAERTAHLRRLRECFLEELQRAAIAPQINGPISGGLPHVVNVSFAGLPGDVLFMRLDLAGLACSRGSACASGSLLPSPVLRAMGLPTDRLQAALRFSFSYLRTEAEIRRAGQIVAAEVSRLATLCSGEQTAAARQP